MRRRSKNKFLVSRHGFQNGVGVVGEEGLGFVGAGQKDEEGDEWEKRRSFSKW